MATTRTYSRLTREVLQLLGRQIRLSRKKRRWSEGELAERAGIARATVQKIEKGDPSCTIGLVFEVASLVGVSLYGAEGREALAPLRQGIEEQLALLPRHTHGSKRTIDDAF
ncbi:MAG: helix-turn-helix transcriptional regulator [Desulfovibrionales bacterium]